MTRYIQAKQSGPILLSESCLGRGSYIGIFKIVSLAENSKYRPIKYKGYSQFQNFDATDTTDSAEDGMWGQLVLEKDMSKTAFQAHYVFQAGDHMGGTLHLICRAI